MRNYERDFNHCSVDVIGEHSRGMKKIEENYLLQEPQDGITLQVRDILLQISLLLSLVSHPVQHLEVE